MKLTAALMYWVIVVLWLTVLGTVIAFYARNPRVFGTTRLLLAVVAVDTFRNIIENAYFGAFFGSQYGLFPESVGTVLGNPFLLILPKIFNVMAGCFVLCILLLRWLPSAVIEHRAAEKNANDLTLLASVDGLTQLYNWRYFEIAARAEWARFQRHRRPLSVLIVDIDHFKSINDRYGHDGGDRVIKCIADLCGPLMRTSDIAARIGGEEFALLLPETDEQAARSVAERLCKHVRECSPPVEGEKLRITVSIGIASATLGMSGIEALLKCADDALYEAKRSGRDRVAPAKVVLTSQLADREMPLAQRPQPSAGF